MTFKLITVAVLSLGLAASGALAQTSGKGNASSTGTSASDSSDGQKKIDPNATNSTTGGAMGNSMGTKDTRTNCAPNLQTQGSATTPNPTGSASVPSGEAGTNTNGQASNC